MANDKKPEETASDSPPRVIADFGGRRRIFERRLKNRFFKRQERRKGAERRSGFDRRSAVDFEDEKSDETEPIFPSPASE